jgi:hypothetical protein
MVDATGTPSLKNEIEVVQSFGLNPHSIAIILNKLGQEQ